MTSAVAACEHYTDKDRRSPIGELEQRAKYQSDQSAKHQLVDVLTGAFKRLHADKRIDAALAVPPSSAGTVSLPTYLSANLALKVGMPDLNDAVRWSGRKGSIKEQGVDAKWASLAQVGLTVDPAVSGKNLLLIDDMYQSGTTAHFVASQLRAAGANEIHLLAVSKGRRDTDNT